jgi:hypothetical protein
VLAIALAATTFLSARPRSRPLHRRAGSGVEAILVAAEPTSVAAEFGLVAASPASAVAWPVSVAGLATMGGDTTEDASLVMALARSAWVSG